MALRLLTTVFVSVATVAAGNYVCSDPTHLHLKANPSSRKCPTADQSSCSDDICCEPKPDHKRCGDANSNITCDDGTFLDSSKWGTDKAACCTARANCSSHTCSRCGDSKREGADTIMCEEAVCWDGECCESDPSVPCCIRTFLRTGECDAGTRPNPDAAGDTKEACCGTVPMCSDFSGPQECLPGYTMVADPAAAMCVDFAGRECTDRIFAVFCCEPVPGTCADFREQASDWCPEGQGVALVDYDKEWSGGSAATASECCSPQATCATIPENGSGIPVDAADAVSPLLGIVVVVLMRIWAIL